MSIAHDIGHSGFARVGTIGRDKARDIREHLLKYPQHDGQIARNRAVVKPERLNDAAITSYQFEATLTSPHVFDIVQDHWQTAVEYLAPHEPVLYSINAFWSRPHDAKAKTFGIQDRHKDHDDDRFLPLFIYLTDVTLDSDGPFSIETAKGNVVVRGEAGATFFADTKRFHRGLPPQNSCRLMMWIRWSVSDPPKAYKDDDLRPISSELAPMHFQNDDGWKRATRLLFDWDKSE